LRHKDLRRSGLCLRWGVVVNNATIPGPTWVFYNAAGRLRTAPERPPADGPVVVAARVFVRRLLVILERTRHEPASEGRLLPGVDDLESQQGGQAVDRRFQVAKAASDAPPLAPPGGSETTSQEQRPGHHGRGLGNRGRR